MSRAHLVLALAAAIVICAPFASAFLRSVDFINDRPTIVRLIAENGLLPCTCDDGVFNCTKRALRRLEDRGRCPRATTVDLSRNLLGRFPDGLNTATKVVAFQNWFTAMPSLSQLNPAITYLDIGQNIIENTTSYQSLGSLQELYVHYTKLGSLWFLPNPCALRILHASNSKLKTLEASVLECHQLEELYLEDNQINSLPSGAFSSLTKLRKLILAENPLRTLSPQLFANLTQLQELSLRQTEISDLPLNIFDSLTQLRNLKLTRNSLQTFPPGIFSTLTHLSSLDLSWNNITILPLEALQSLAALEELNLSHNKLKTISDSAFLSLVNLKEIHFFENQLESIGINLIPNRTELEAVSVDKNPLSSLPRGLLSHGTSLKFALLPCVRNSTDLHLLSHVAMVSINGCGEMRWQSRAYAALTHTKMLVVNNNQVISIANDTLDGLTNLQVLDVGHNQISELPANFLSYTPNLKVLTVYRNNLRTIPENLFSGLIHIQDIFLSYNILSEIPENVFQGLTTLEKVDLSFNELSSIPTGLFRNLPAMYEINLDSNRLKRLPVLAPSWFPLKRVSIEGNQMTEVPREALLSLLGAGDQERYVIISEDEGEGVRLQNVEWLQREQGIVLARAATSDCRCWLVRRGAALLYLCLDAVCPSEAGEGEEVTWEAVMRANAPTPAPTA